MRSWPRSWRLPRRGRGCGPVSVTPGDGQPGLAVAPDDGALPLLPAPVTGPDGAPWGALLRAPDSEDGLPEATTRLTALAGLTGAARPALAAVHGGTALTRALLYEEARLRHGLPALLIDPGLDQDQAVTAVLSGRADLVGVPAENAMIMTREVTGAQPDQ